MYDPKSRLQLCLIATAAGNLNAAQCWAVTGNRLALLLLSGCCCAWLLGAAAGSGTEAPGRAGRPAVEG
jgi:hypothetical protein